MATETRGFWANFFDIPQKNESYFFYIVSIKFIWAPIVSFVSLIINWFQTNNAPAPVDTPSTGESYGTMSSGLSSSDDTVAENPLLKEFKKSEFDTTENGNTPLTRFLAERVFTETHTYEAQEVLATITELCHLAKKDKDAEKLLTSANRLNISSGTDMNSAPINTPLMLLVKAGHLEAIRLILPFYTKEDLMKTTPRGNSVFHIASITGQREVFEALKQRANELGIWDQCKTHENKKGHTVIAMLNALLALTGEPLFKPLLNFSDEYLGGEEINKVPASEFGGMKIFTARNEVRKFHSKEQQSKPDQGATSGMSLN